MTRRKRSWQPSLQDFYSAIQNQNPWRETGLVPDAWAFKRERSLAKHLWKRVIKQAPRRFQLILGPRRVGKTTAMFQTVRHLMNDAKILPECIWWLRMDHPLFIESDLGSLVKSLIEQKHFKLESPLFLFIDEITYAKNWDLWLKTFYDEQWPVMVVASSSSTAALSNRKDESGVGRWETQFLPPYLF